MPVRLSASPSATVRRLQPKMVSACRELPSQYFKAISASKARRPGHCGGGQAQIGNLRRYQRLMKLQRSLAHAPNMTSRNSEGFTSLENHLSSLTLTQYNLSRKSPKLVWGHQKNEHGRAAHGRSCWAVRPVLVLSPHTWSLSCMACPSAREQARDTGGVKRVVSEGQMPRATLGYTYAIALPACAAPTGAWAATRSPQPVPRLLRPRTSGQRPALAASLCGLARARRWNSRRCSRKVVPVYSMDLLT
jgi:hypothetical protein